MNKEVQKEIDIAKKKVELSATLKWKLKMVSHIVNALNERCIVKHEIKIYDEDENIIIDVFLAPFLNSIEQYDAISQVSAQLLSPMLSNDGRGETDYWNLFEWSVIKKSEKEGAKCFIRFVIYPKPYRELFCCKKCGTIATRTYGGRGSSRHCENHGFLEYNEYEHKRLNEIQ